MKISLLKFTFFVFLLGLSMLLVVGIKACQNRPRTYPAEFHRLSDQEVVTFSAKAESGDKDAALKVALHYLFMSSDPKKTDYWLKYAASLGSKEAQSWLGGRCPEPN